MRINVLVVLVTSCIFFGLGESEGASIDKPISSVVDQKNVGFTSGNADSTKAQLLAAPTEVTLKGKKISATSGAYLNAMPGIPDKNCKSAGGLIVPVTLTSKNKSALTGVSITEVWVHSNGIWWAGSISSIDVQDLGDGKRVVGRGCRARLSGLF